jgi:transcriptional regulator with XRE-family HTH domain
MKSKNYSEIAKAAGLSHRDIAKLAGVSHNTVYKVLTGKGEPFYSKATEEKIHKIVETGAARQQKNLERLMGIA